MGRIPNTEDNIVHARAVLRALQAIGGLDALHAARLISFIHRGGISTDEIAERLDTSVSVIAAHLDSPATAA
ncbi:hypothetical protein [Nocardia wallacei]|uniref:hypothetical protein n=1 Tax=Nocardia wallacei TaxID=480035 RepID=UPI0024540DBF|nr:hypothetical protein [Nocardia wallacei]